MEFQIPSFPLLFTFLLLIFTLITIQINKHKKNKSPPGPFKFPLIGNLPQLTGALPYHRFTDLAQIHGPVMSIQIGQIPSVVISSAEAAKEVLKTNDVHFAGRPIYLAAKVVFYNRKDIMFGEYGDQWRQLRKICTLELLSAKRVQSFRPVREQKMLEFVQFLRSKAGSPVNLTKALFVLANSITAGIANGKEFGDQEAVLSVIEEGTKAATGFSFADMFPSLKFLPYINGHYWKLYRLHKRTDKVLEDIINEHRESRKNGENCGGQVENLVDVLLDVQESGNLQVPLTNENIKGTILQMFGGGSDTSAIITEWAMAELMRHPVEMKKVQEEIRREFGEKGKVEESRLDELTYLKCIVKETLRLHPPGALIARESNEAKTIGGYDIQPNTQVLVNVWAINRDPSIWSEPEKFQPERFRDNPINYNGTHFEFIPFGAGKKICPGITLAIVNIELFLATLLYHFDWKFPDGTSAQTLDMTEVSSGVISRKVELEIVPILFCPLPN